MGQALSTFLVPGLPSCSGGSWVIQQAAKTADHRHLAKHAQHEPLLLLACTVKGYGLVHVAAEAGNFSTLQLLVQLIEQHAEQLSARLQEVLMRHESGVELLKSLRSKVQQESLLLVPELVLQALLSWQDSRGVTPLMLAARNGHAECLELLLEHGANPLLLDTVNSRSCLHYAAGAGHTRCVSILLNSYVTVQQAGQQEQGQGQADSQQQQQRRLVLLPAARLKDGIRGMTSFVDLRTRTGFSALHYATFWGFVGCVQALLTGGATDDLPMLNPSRQHSELPVVNGSTPLHLAADCGHTAIAALLLHAHVLRMERVAAAASAEARQDWLPWEGVGSQDPRIELNASRDTPLMLAHNRCNSSSTMRALLDPCVPINNVLPAVLGALFGGPPRFGVPALAVLAKAALDQHLVGTLDELEQQQQLQHVQRAREQQALEQQQQEEEEGNELQPYAGPLDCVGSGTDAASASHPTRPEVPTLSTLDDLVSRLHSACDIFDGDGSSDCRGSISLSGANSGGSGSSCCSSAASSAAPSRSTSFGSISALLSSVSSSITRSSSLSSTIAGCSPGSTCSMPSISSGSGGVTAAAGGGGCGSNGGSNGCAAGCSKHTGGSTGVLAGAGCCKHTGGSNGVLAGTGGCCKHTGGAVHGGHLRTLSIDSTIAESVGTSAVDHTCAICFDASANIMLASCSHRLCTSCARSLLQRASVSKPAVCPFCRGGLSGFLAAPRVAS